jgi:beta-lactamase regulating signal transducer with metallopeptidase domain
MSSVIAHAALTVAASLFNSIWEGAIIFGAVWLILRFSPKLGAATRYAIWLCTLGALVVIPVLSVAFTSQPAATSHATSLITHTTTQNAAPSIVLPTHADAGAQVQPPSQIAADSPAATAPAAITPGKPQITIPQSFAIGIALVWLLAAIGRAIILARNMCELASIRRDATLWSTANAHPVLVSDRVGVPIAVGFLKPAVILPHDVVGELDADALETVVIHEIAHLQRHDVWTNAWARIAEALVVLNPVAWFVMRRIATEREIACDDWVVARTGAGDAFAQILATLANGSPRRMPIGAPSAIGSPHSVVVRIERLLDAAPRRLRLSISALGGALVFFAALAILLQTVSPVLAYAPATAVTQSHANNVAVAAGSVTANKSACPVPNRPAALEARAFTKNGVIRRQFPFWSPNEVAAKMGTAHLGTFVLTIDAAGKLRNVTASGLKPTELNDRAKKFWGWQKYAPALRNCAPVTSTVRTAMYVAPRAPGAGSNVAPVYPAGWSKQHVSACKIPSLWHSGVPTITPAEFGSSLKLHETAVRVRVNAAGAVINAYVVKTSGKPALDNAVLAAARAQTYPMTETSGFKEVRPNGAPPEWNKTHGSETYTGCTPLPAEYVWTTSFGKAMEWRFGPMEMIGSMPR